EEGFVVETGDLTPSRDYVVWMREVPGLAGAVRGPGAFDVTDGADEPAVVASAVEFLLEGLHLARRLNKDRIPGGTVYHRGRRQMRHDRLFAGSPRPGPGAYSAHARRPTWTRRLQLARLPGLFGG